MCEKEHLAIDHTEEVVCAQNYSIGHPFAKTRVANQGVYPLAEMDVYP